MGRVIGSGIWQAVRAGMGDAAFGVRGSDGANGERPGAAPGQSPAVSPRGPLSLAREKCAGMGDAHTRSEVRVPPRPTQ